MKIAYLSVFPPNTNGIGDYTRDLCRAASHRSPDAGFVVLGDRAQGSVDPEMAVDRCCSFRGNWVSDALAAVDRARPDLVHLQHGRYMGRDARVPAFLEGLANRGIRSVITLHAVYPERRRRIDSLLRWPPPRFHRALGRLADHVVIHHNAGALEHLVACGIPRERISVIPHGTPEVEVVTPASARRDLGLPDRSSIVLFLGFIAVSKGVDTVVRAFDRVVREVPGALLVIAGRPEPDFPNPQYVWWLRRLMRRGLAGKWIDYRPGYLAEHLIPSYLAAADLMVLPHRQRYGSASGIFHRALSVGCPVLASRCPKFEEGRETFAAEAFAEPNDPAAWARSIVNLLKNTAVRQQISLMSTELGRKTSWPSVAGLHLQLYRRLLGANEPSSREAACVNQRSAT